MSQMTLQKLEKLNAQIQKLEHEKNALKDSLKKSLLKILDDEFILKCDFETLAGGILSIKATFTDTSDSSKKLKEGWKREGAQYFQKSKKSAAPGK